MAKPWMQHGRMHCAAGGQALELLLSAEGGFVRDILLDELAKGLDASWRLSLDSAVASARSGLLALLGVRRHKTALPYPTPCYPTLPYHSD